MKKRKTWKSTHKFTMNGWLTSMRILFSFLTCSTCFNRMTSDIANIFIAQCLFVLRSKHRQTRPKVPVPNGNASKRKTNRKSFKRIALHWSTDWHGKVLYCKWFWMGQTNVVFYQFWLGIPSMYIPKKKQTWKLWTIYAKETHFWFILKNKT